MRQRVAVTGASGFVGRAVIAALRTRGATAIALGRDGSDAFPPGVESRRFDPNGAPDPQAFAGADAVVHLTGESVAGRWTAEKKRAIERSRIAGTRTLVESLRGLERRPSVLVSASAVGYYGDRGDEPLVESSPRGAGFLADVCEGWENAARECEALGIRSVRMRTGIALGEGGALAQMLRPFQLGIGGRLGSGRQYVPWIELRDLASLYCFAVETPALRGAVNAVAPDYATNARLAQAIGAALRRPSLLPAPASALRLVLGEFADSLLVSQLVLPAAAQDADFRFERDRLEAALFAILRRNAGPPPYLHALRRTQIVPRSPEEVFAFFAQPRNLAALSPPWLSFASRRLPPRIARGEIVEYRLRWHGLPIAWKTLVADYEPPHRFVDVALRGPCLSWRHEHAFRSTDRGVEIGDRIEYVLPLAPLGEAAQPLVSRDLERIFQFRRDAIERALGSEAAAPQMERS